MKELLFAQKIIKQNPLMTDRFRKAQEIVNDNLVSQVGNQRYKVISQESDWFYIVSQKNERYSCTCQDWNKSIKYRPNNAPWLSLFSGSEIQPWCKHIIAVMIKESYAYNRAS